MGNPIWFIFWFLVFWFISFFVAFFCAAFYIILLIFTTCFPALTVSTFGYQNKNKYWQRNKEIERERERGKRLTLSLSLVLYNNLTLNFIACYKFQYFSSLLQSLTDILLQCLQFPHYCAKAMMECRQPF